MVLRKVDSYAYNFMNESYFTACQARKNQLDPIGVPVSLVNY